MFERDEINRSDAKAGVEPLRLSNKQTNVYGN